MTGQPTCPNGHPLPNAPAWLAGAAQWTCAGYPRCGEGEQGESERAVARTREELAASRADKNIDIAGSMARARGRRAAAAVESVIGEE